MIRIFIRVDASTQIGYGHLTRCICIADYFRSRAAECIFLIKESGKEIEEIISHQHSYRYLRLQEEKDIIQLMKTHRPHVVLLDVNTPVVFETRESYRNYTFLLTSHAKCVTVSFEEFEEDEYLTDMVIIPYVGADRLFNRYEICENYLLGEKYFIFRDEFLTASKAVIRQEVDRVFICMGGSDPNKLTEKCINLLIMSGFRFRIRVFFSKLETHRRHLIEELLLQYEGGGEVIVNGQNLADEMSSCDLGIVNSGLIKYETSMLGLPCIAICNGQEHELVMRFFEQEAAIVQIGSLDGSQETAFINELKRLTADYSVRKKMFEINTTLFDGLGLVRVYDRIIHLVNKNT